MTCHRDELGLTREKQGRVKPFFIPNDETRNEHMARMFDLPAQRDGVFAFLSRPQVFFEEAENATFVGNIPDFTSLEIYADPKLHWSAIRLSTGLAESEDDGGSRRRSAGMDLETEAQGAFLNANLAVALQIFNVLDFGPSGKVYSSHIVRGQF